MVVGVCGVVVVGVAVVVLGGEDGDAWDVVI